MFRFLSWFDNLKLIYYYLFFKKESVFDNVLKALMNLCSLYYHLTDNLVWYANLGIISEYLIGNVSLKSIKRIFSLIRNFIKLYLDIKRYRSLSLIVDGEIPECQLKDQIQLSKALIVHDLLRILILFSELSIKPFSLIAPILIDSFCVVDSLISLYKLLRQFTIEDENAVIQKMDSLCKIKLNAEQEQKCFHKITEEALIEIY